MNTDLEGAPNGLFLTSTGCLTELLVSLWHSLSYEYEFFLSTGGVLEFVYSCEKKNCGGHSLQWMIN